MILFSRLRMEKEGEKEIRTSLENRIRSKDRKVAASAAPASLVSSSVHHGVASKGSRRFERTFSARSTVANETRNNSLRFYSSTPTFATIEPSTAADFASLFLPNFAPYKREKERKVAV